MNNMFLPIIKKEFIHIWRDPQTLVIVLLMPLLMLLIYGYAITLEMKQIKTVIVDLSKTPQSRLFIEKIASTDFFKITDTDVAYSKIEDIFLKRRAGCILIIPGNFSKTQPMDPEVPIQLLIDASDPNAAHYINSYINKINGQFNLVQNDNNSGPFKIKPVILYNPDFKSSFFFVPGLVAIIILLISALLTSIAIVREKELGSMEQILVSPLRPNHLIVGKLVPYLAISLADSILILLAAHFWFKVPMYGSVPLLGFFLILYIMTGLSFGLLISTGTNSQQVAMMGTLVVTILPTFLLSGYIFPIRSMPLVFQIISQIIPATHFLKIIRGIMLKGAGAADLLPQMIALAMFSLLLILISIKKFKTNLE